MELYDKRFNEILADTIDFIPERIKKKIQQEEIKVFNLTDKEQVEILAENLKQNTVVALSENLAVDLDLIKKENFKQEEETKKKLESITKVKDVIEIVTKNKNGSTILLTPSEITKKEDIIIAKVFKTENSELPPPIEVVASWSILPSEQVFPRSKGCSIPSFTIYI